MEKKLWVHLDKKGKLLEIGDTRKELEYHCGTTYWEHFPGESTEPNCKIVKAKLTY